MRRKISDGLQISRGLCRILYTSESENYIHDMIINWYEIVGYRYEFSLVFKPLLNGH